MKKVAIFNVGGAASAYVEIDDVKIVIDLGAGNDFSPVNDFLVPLFERKGMQKHEDDKYHFAQLFLTHLDNDHISNYPEFEKHLMSRLMTVPNDHREIAEHLKIKRDKVPQNEIVESILLNMQFRKPGKSAENPNYDIPLDVCEEAENFLSLFYVTPQTCEELDAVSDSEYPDYANNISLVLYLEANGHSILFPGDIMNNGIECLIQNSEELRTKLETQGVDFLIAPHHGLDTSFPTALFNIISGNKTRLNIISEKKIEKGETENRHNVDGRYYSGDYATGVNVIDGVKPDAQYGIITSVGHIVIDFEPTEPTVKRVYDNDGLIAEFL